MKARASLLLLALPFIGCAAPDPPVYQDVKVYSGPVLVREFTSDGPVRRVSIRQLDYSPAGRLRSGRGGHEYIFTDARSGATVCVFGSVRVTSK